ncbi:Asp23/Gls24 family envelope stress response protein, partial [Clavibacter nebraskensis]
LGGATARALDAASRAIRGTSTGPGVTVSEEAGGTVIDIDLVVEYPTPVQDVVAETREQVARAAREIAPGAVRVDIRVTDVHGPFDDEQSPAGAALEKAKDAGSDALERAKAAGSEGLEKARAAGAVLADSAEADVEETREAAEDRYHHAADFDTYAAHDGSEPEVTVIVDGHGDGATRVEVDGPGTVEVQGDRVEVDGRDAADRS